jgi:hypothetical protein
VIVGTGNHWLLDAVVGWLVVLVGWEIARSTSRVLETVEQPVAQATQRAA